MGGLKWSFINLIKIVVRRFLNSDKEEYIKVQTGDAVFWEKDEWHETKTETGLIAIVIESEEISPSSFMLLRK
ncbi:hypothetical protein [Bacillus sp. FJAT-45066]|uniref:hypothetical protein n=1 Tax=Bacillus sp. FJAT-45066 TaxID=2011010 RepID=UPI001596BF59|nr:hypothetical protein [Bacillus sp. FJAT-45066]